MASHTAADMGYNSVRGGGYGYDAELEKSRKSRYNPHLGVAAQEWIEEVLGRRVVSHSPVYFWGVILYFDFPSSLCLFLSLSLLSRAPFKNQMHGIILSKIPGPLQMPSKVGWNYATSSIPSRRD
jgi:hypothetical protein